MEKKTQITTRPPIVVVLGHIDHGKSSLLEAIKDFRITARESGGITQHIGAYQIEEKKGKITFLDTPGHEAFSQMRSRGAKVADIAILVIDAAEGLKPQTKEVLLNIKEFDIPFIVALNKTDKPEANPEKVKGALLKEGFSVESLGGKIPSIEVSAKTKKGIPELLELILLISEMEELKADLQKPAEGVVIESYLDNSRGPTATLLLTDGCLEAGEIIATNSALVKIKSVEDFQKNQIKEAFPSDPIIIFGFNRVPKVGEEFKVFPDLESAEKHIENSKKEVISPDAVEAAEGQRILNLIIKADVLGSLEAVEGILKSLPQERVVLRTLKSEVGNINESDVKLASSSRATILGFRVKADTTAAKISEREKTRILLFDVIYELVEGVRKLMEKVVQSQDIKTDLGKAKVLAKFLTDKNRQIIGGRAIEGEIRKGASVEVFRNEEKIGQGKMINLQRNKKDAALIQKGEECGILFEGEVKIEEGDVLLFYTEERIKGQL
ncbi:MAG: translation initiation factor IF-2 [Candidatus Nealsonbacteria bacterium]|nr:translation initiation factor IF-2 [Candidatus Nealsonbacteria bacterium]